MRTSTAVVIAIVTLIIGLGAGYAAASHTMPADAPTAMTHTMPDGSMMPNDTSMDSMMMDMNAELRGKAGAELEKAFIDGMIVHHQGAIDMAQLLLAGTTRPELVQLGNAIITAQTGEIAQMQQWRAEWFGQ